jgi:DNA-binding NarL/FixJ family response regulator
VPHWPAAVIASGYLLKQTPTAKLLEAITDLHRGGSPMSVQIARLVVETFQPQSRRPTGGPGDELSPHLLAQGHLYKEIAGQLQLSVETVRTHIRNIYQKLHVHGRTEAIHKVYGQPKAI